MSLQNHQLAFQRKLLIRADASAAIGSGHVMRMIALAQAWIRRGGAVVLASKTCPDLLCERLSFEKITLEKIDEGDSWTEDAQATLKLLQKLGSDCIALDGYNFDANYQQKFHGGRIPLLVVDDLCHAKNFHCHLILNQNLGIEAGHYELSAPGSKILAGPRFSLLRNEFLIQRNWQRDVRQAQRLLITMGGSDPPNATCIVLSAIALVADLKLDVRVIVGESNLHREQIESMAKSLPLVSVRKNINDMAAEYRWADFAIAAGGSTNWEMSLFGLPRLTVVLAENQRSVAEELERMEAALNLGEVAAMTPSKVAAAIRRLVTEEPLRHTQAQNSRQMVDGRGADRVAEALSRQCLQEIQKVVVGKDLQLRPANKNDSARLLKWRNDPLTRRFSLQPDEVTALDHERWFDAVLNGTRQRVFVAETSETKPVAIGTVRFEFGDAVEISWTVAPAMRGVGWGKRIVQLACQYANCELVARIRIENLASIRIAIGCGFESWGCSDRIEIYGRDVPSVSMETGISSK